eukprot:6190176-Pleurochrysis_carterae.AAC.2
MLSRFSERFQFVRRTPQCELGSERDAARCIRQCSHGEAQHLEQQRLETNELQRGRALKSSEAIQTQKKRALSKISDCKTRARGKSREEEKKRKCSKRRAGSDWAPKAERPTERTREKGRLAKKRSSTQNAKKYQHRATMLSVHM